LTQVFQIARHGARTPSSFEFKPSQYPETLGELTILGRVQHYFLGKEMRNRYMTISQFLPEHYDPSQVIIKSSSKRRVVESALAFVNGLYPQENGTVHTNMYAKEFLLEKLLPLSKIDHIVNDLDILEIMLNEEWAQKIVEVLPSENDLFFHADQGKNCHAAKGKLNEIKRSDRIAQLEDTLKNTVYPHIVEVINTALGTDRLSVDSLNIQTAKRVLDSYRCNTFHNVEYPLFNETTLDLLVKLRYNFIYEILYKDELVSSIAATKLLEDIYRYINSTKENRKGPKYVFYAAHDHNMEALFSLLLDTKMLEEKKYFMIDFASMLSIEVHKNENEEDEKKAYSIRLFYNDEPLFIKWCEGHDCTLEKFETMVNRFVIPNLEEFCQIRAGFMA